MGSPFEFDRKSMETETAISEFPSGGKNVTRVGQLYQFHKNRLVSPNDGQVSKDKHVQRWFDQENLIYVRCISLNVLKKPCIKAKKVIDKN